MSSKTNGKYPGRVKEELEDQAATLIGQPVAVLCARYWYRGILSKVGNKFIVLVNARAVEVTGSAQNDTPEREDPIPSDVILRLDFVEIICQPTWVSHQMDEKVAATAGAGTRTPRRRNR